MKRVILTTLIALALAKGWAGAGPSPTAGFLRIAIPREEGSLNPYTYQSGYPGWLLMTLVYDTLYYPDLDNVPQPWLARDARPSQGGRVWTVTLRPGLRWHDGRPLTAEDVKFTFEYVKKFTHARWTPQAADIERIEVQDSLTVVFRLTKPVAWFRQLPLADLPLLPKHIWEGVTEPRRFHNTVGSGPYRLVEAQPPQFYRLVANDAYFAGRPRVRELVLPIVADASVSFNALQAGEVDANARYLLPELVAQFQRIPGLRVVRGPGFASTILQFNLEHPLLRDVRLRRAIAHAINTQLTVRLLMLGFAEVGAPGYLHPASPLYNPAVRFVPSKARAVPLLNEAGYEDRNRDGVREASDGTPLRFSLLARSGDPIRIRTADLIRTWLKDIGIEVQVRVMDDPSIISLVWPDFDVCKGRRFDMVIFGWSAPVMTRPNALTQMFHSDCRIGTINIGGYRNPEFDRLAELHAATTDARRQRELVFRMQEIVARDMPIHTLFYPDVLLAYGQTKYDGWAFQKGQGILNKLSFVSAPR